MSRRRAKIFSYPCDKLNELETALTAWFEANPRAEVINFRQNASGGFFYVTIFFWD